MNSFRFRLEKLLRLRESAQAMKLNEFGMQQKQLNAERTKLGLFEGEAFHQLEDMRQTTESPFKSWAHTSNLKYVARLDRVIDFQRQRTKAQEASVETARQSYVEARRDTKVLANLREKKYTAWKEDVGRLEQKRIDDRGFRLEGDE